jgi:phospholipid-binding lipoprotein MlaA
VKAALALVRRAAAVAAVALVAGCATVPPSSPSSSSPSSSAPSPDDPFEPANRAMFEFNEVADKYVVKPVIDAYTTVVPQFLRTGVSNVFNNIDDFFSGVNALLQGKPEKAGDTFGRVLLNTFVLGGIFDVAADLGLERGDEDFGQTFGVWGFPQGPYLFVPFLGPTTVRDGTGLLVRVYLGPVGFLPDVAVRNSLYGLAAVDIRAQASDALGIIDTAAIDKYLFIRNAYLQRRKYLLYDGKPPPEKEE